MQHNLVHCTVAAKYSTIQEALSSSLFFAVQTRVWQLYRWLCHSVHESVPFKHKTNHCWLEHMTSHWLKQEIWDNFDNVVVFCLEIFWRFFLQCWQVLTKLIFFTSLTVFTIFNNFDNLRVNDWTPWSRWSASLGAFVNILKNFCKTFEVYFSQKN